METKTMQKVLENVWKNNNVFTTYPKNGFKVIYSGGDSNGAIRYYDTIQIARREAQKYYNRNTKKSGLCEKIYCDIYILTKYGKNYRNYKLFQSIGD